MTLQSAREVYFNNLCRHPNNTTGLKSLKEGILGPLNKARLYKYCRIETAQKILESGLLLQPPDSFNDPFDCLARVNAFATEYRFWARTEDIQFALKALGQLPQKYRLEQYQSLVDMRTAYCFAMTCFGERYDEHLMWSHYADNHKGVCLEFDVSEVIDDIHPCLYTHEMPTSETWRSDDISLALIKGTAWAYEKEWRFIKRTIRPKMRVLARMTQQIYQAVHSNAAFSKTDHEEWGQINSELMKQLEGTYNTERIVRIKPSGIYLGLNFGYQYTNVYSGKICDETQETADRLHIPVKRMCVRANSFDLIASEVIERTDWLPL